MNDTTRRFLNTVLERVPEARIVEVRLFPAIRQGGIESGVAVLAVEPETQALLDASLAVTAELAADADLPGTEPGAAVLVADRVASDVEVAIAHPADASLDPEDAAFGANTAPPVHGDTQVVPDVADAVFEALERESVRIVTTEGVNVRRPMASPAVGERLVDMVTAELAADSPALEPDESIALGDILALPSPGSPALPPRQAGDGGRHQRLAILCARYKLVFKGPERGKWDLEIMHQADAPIETLDRVIAGVVRRCGEESDPERFNRQTLRASLDAPVWAQTA